MVILHVKRTDLNQFLYETNTSVPVADILDALVRCKFKQAILDDSIGHFDHISSIQNCEMKF